VGPAWSSKGKASGPYPSDTLEIEEKRARLASPGGVFQGISLSSITKRKRESLVKPRGKFEKLRAERMVGWLKASAGS